MGIRLWLVATCDLSRILGRGGLTAAFFVALNPIYFNTRLGLSGLLPCEKISLDLAAGFPQPS